MPFWADLSLHRLHRCPSLLEVSRVVPSFFIYKLKMEGFFAPEAHISARCGWDKGPGLGVWSLPSDSSFFEISLSLLRFIFILRINFGLSSLPVVLMPSQLGRLEPCKPQIQLERGLISGPQQRFTWFTFLPPIGFPTWKNRTTAFRGRHIFLKPLSTV